MENVRVKKAELLDILGANRAAHRDLFLRAVDGYKARLIEELERRLEDVKAGRRVDLAVQLAEPVDQTSDYDRVIRMLNMSQDETIELSEHDFSCYVMDDWHWKHQVMLTNSLYAR